MVLRWLVQVLHPPKKFERPLFGMVAATALKNYAVEVTFSGMTSLLTFIKVYQLVQKLIGRRTQDGDLVNQHFSFGKKNRLIN
jgi:hypothetical protein